ncbi:MAG TPA: methylenetetrahydrofolate reductase [NAD(P)H] [Fibrobacteria bacterium]|nr:methylenetetrahydrofolate reductase [NAD(P)H] [Fibrobacteria bacterium]
MSTSFFERLRQGSPTLSFELFPPKNPAGWGVLYSTLGEISKLSPDFISVTYGAGGSTRAKTVDLVARIQSELGIETMAHLTCVGHSRTEIGDILSALESAGVRNVLALRGDPPKGDTTFQPHPDGFGHASDLIAYIRSHGNRLNIGCAFYPEKHMEAPSLESDLGFLKLKQDNGGQFSLSQLFFDNEIFYRFRDKAAKAGVTMPLIAGIMPVLDVNQLGRFKELSGCAIPERLVRFLGDGKDGDVVSRGVEYATEQCLDLLRNGVAGIHLYCLNRSHSSARITENLRMAGHFPVAAPVPAKSVSPAAAKA